MNNFVNAAFFAIMVGFSGLSTGPVSAETVQTISTNQDLVAAVSNAVPGTVFQLEAGDYGDLKIRGVAGTIEDPIVLQSKDPANPARLSRMDIREASNIVIDGVEFNFTPQAGDRDNARPFQVFTTRNLTIRNALFDGAGGFGDGAGTASNAIGFGLSVRASAGITVEDSEFRNFQRGLVFADVVDVTIVRNSIHSMRVDGMILSQVERVLIEDNLIRDFIRSPNSAGTADMIQFWTSGAERPSRDISIRNNVLNSGNGSYTQSIFLRNEEVDSGRAGLEMFYRNVLIEQNVIVNAYLHGITVGETDGLTIQNNTLLHNVLSDGSGNNPALWRPQIRVAETAQNVTVVKNIAHALPDPYGRPDWVVSGNLEIQDQSLELPNHYTTLLVAAQTGDPSSLASFRYLPDGAAAKNAIGAVRLMPGADTTLPVSGALPQGPAVRVLADPQNRSRFLFDAEIGLSVAGIASESSKFEWDFGDGNAEVGGKVAHDYETPGSYFVTVRITQPDGTILEGNSRVTARPQEIVAFEASTGEVVSYVEATPTRLPLVVGSGTIQMGDGHPVVSIPREMIAPVFGSDGFDLTIRVRSTKGYKGAGELFRIHPFLIATVTARGSLEIRFKTPTSSPLKFLTGATKINSGNWVDLTFRYSDAKGRFEVLADGITIGSRQTKGVMPGIQSWGLYFGNPFAERKTFNGEIESLVLKAGEDGRTIADQ